MLLEFLVQTDQGLVLALCSFLSLCTSKFSFDGQTVCEKATSSFQTQQQRNALNVPAGTHPHCSEKQPSGEREKREKGKTKREK